MRKSVNKFSQIRYKLKQELKKVPIILSNIQYLIKPNEEIVKLRERLCQLIGSNDLKELHNFEKQVGLKKLNVKHFQEMQPQTQLGQMMYDLLNAMQSYIKESYNPTYLQVSQRNSRQRSSSSIVVIDKWTELREMKAQQKREEKTRQMDDIQRYQDQFEKEQILRKKRK